MKYIVNIKKHDILDDFEKNRHNTVQIIVRDITGNNINKSCKVEFSLSKNAMLGLAKSLISRAVKNQINGPLHFYPIKPDGDIVQTLGLLIAPGSVEPIFDFWDVPPLDLDIKKLEKKEPIQNSSILYEIELDDKRPEDFEIEGNNIGEFKVLDFYNNDISNKCRYIEIGLSIDAMLGLGTELIRFAHNFEEGKKISIIPASKENGAQQSMGIFLTPDSCELVIEYKKFESIEKYIEEYKKNN